MTPYLQDPSALSSPGGELSITNRSNPFFSSAGGTLEVFLNVELGIDSGDQGMMQEFHSPRPVITCRCCCELELGDHDTLLSVGHHRGSTSRLVHNHPRLTEEQQHHNCSSTVDERRNSHVCSRPIHEIELGKINTTSTTPATAEYCSSMMHDHNQEERDLSTTLMKSLLGCNGSYDSELPRNNGGTNNNPNCTQYGNNSSSGASPDEIECFDVADISAACQLLEMSAASHSGGGVENVEQSQQQPDHSCENIFRVSDFDKIHGQSSSLAFQSGSELWDLAETISSAHDEEAETSAIQGTRATWAATNYDSTASTTSRDRPPRIELTRTYGKKRIKPKKDEREFNSVFKMNMKDLAGSNYDILDRPLRKRQYKSLRQLLEIT